MKTQLRKFRLLERFIDMDMFFNVSINSHTITLNAWATRDKLLNLNKWFDFEYQDEQSWLVAKRNGIIIYLSLT